MMKRNFSGDSHSHLKEVETWKKYFLGNSLLSLPSLDDLIFTSIVMFAGCGVVMAGNIWYISTHEHLHGTPKEVPYMHIRSKPFPWRCSDCELFNGACWNGEESH